jgi:hypothetical protein
MQLYYIVRDRLDLVDTQVLQSGITEEVALALLVFYKAEAATQTVDTTRGPLPALHVMRWYLFPLLEGPVLDTGIRRSPRIIRNFK